MNDVIRLVFDNWENGEPIPNGYVNNIRCTPSYFHIPIAVTAVLRKRNYKVRFLPLEKANANSYYIINHQSSFEFIFGQKQWIIPDEVEDYIRTKDLKVIFLSEHESFYNVEIHLNNLKKLISNKGLKEENFYVLNNNSNLYDAKHNIQTNINVFKTNWLIEIVTEFNTTDIKFISDKKFIFLLHNRTPKAHRTGLLILLKYLGILDKTDIVDWSLLYTMIGHSFDAVYLDTTFINLHSPKLRPIYKQFLTTSKLSYYETNKDWFIHPDKYSERKYNELKSFQESYINIVTETFFDNTDIHITEKTYRPFLCFQIPLFLASYKHIFRLKQEHPSLHLFEDLIDHSYDNEIDNNKRLEMVANEIYRLSNMRDTIREYYIKNELKIKQNREYILSFSNNKTTFEFFKSLINE